MLCYSWLVLTPFYKKVPMAMWPPRAPNWYGRVHPASWEALCNILSQKVILTSMFIALSRRHRHCSLVILGLPGSLLVHNWLYCFFPFCWGQDSKLGSKDYYQYIWLGKVIIMEEQFPNGHNAGQLGRMMYTPVHPWSLFQLLDGGGAVDGWWVGQVLVAHGFHNVM